MGATLRILGLVVLACAVVAAVAGELEAVPRTTADAWLPTLLKAGAACLALGILMGVLSPILRYLGKGRCARCGTGIEKGQTYCNDHLQETVHEYQRQARERHHLY